MIALRPLKEKDAVLMLEWMHDAEIQKAFRRDMSSMSLEEAKAFCRAANRDENLVDGGSLHYAIVNEADEYMGTISLKSIDLVSGTAEYAISLRRCAQGKGIGGEATRLILEKGFKFFGLHRIYLNVLEDNIRAIRFYEKNGFTYEGEFRKHLFLQGEYKSLKWYGVLKEEYLKGQNNGKDNAQPT